MDYDKLYDYVVNQFAVSGEFCRLFQNVLSYAAAQGFDDLEACSYLGFMLEDTIGIEEKEISNCIDKGE